MDISERLRAERVRLKLTQEEMAALGGLSKLAQLRYEKGERKPDSAFLATLADAGVDVLYVITGERSKPVPPQELLPPEDRELLERFHDLPKRMQTAIDDVLLSAWLASNDRRRDLEEMRRMLEEQRAKGEAPPTDAAPAPATDD